MTFALTTPAAVERIRARNGVVNAYVTTRLEAALAEAAALAREPARSPLHGVPYGLKDEWDTAGIVTTGGSFRHRDRVPLASSPVHEVFAAAGAVLVGKTNLSDLGLAPEASSWVVGSTRNPHDPARTAGGSSGGAAAAVADGMQAFDWGTDIGGSIRLPAAFCGVYGLRLASETWPIVGLFPSIPSGLRWMGAQGPLARGPAQLRGLIAVAAPRLRTGTATPFVPRGVSLLVPDELGYWPSFAADVGPALEAAIGPTRVDHGLPGTTRMRGVYTSLWASHFEDLLESDPSISFAEGLRAVVSSVLLRGRLGDYRFHPATAELLALITLGRYTLFRSRRGPLRQADAVRGAFDAAWSRGQVVALPVCCYSAPRVGRSNRNRELLSCTIPGNLADATGLSIPWGRFADGLPRGLQLMGPPGSEEALLDIAERLHFTPAAVPPRPAD